MSDKKNATVKKTMTVTLRIDKNIMDILNDEAENDSISLNSLINHVLNRYIKWGKFEDKTSLIPIVSPVVKELFACLDKDKTIELGRGIARDAIYNIILFMNGEVNLDILIGWFKERMKNCSEIYDKKNEDGNRKIIFKHDLGETWSLYHKTILESICHDILSVPIKISTTNSTLVIDITNN